MIRNFPGPGSASTPQPLHSHGSWFIVHWHWPQHPRHHRFSLGCTAGNGFLLSAVTEWPPTENCVSSLSLSIVHTILTKKLNADLFSLETDFLLSTFSSGVEKGFHLGRKKRTWNWRDLKMPESPILTQISRQRQKVRKLSGCSWHLWAEKDAAPHYSKAS